MPPDAPGRWFGSLAGTTGDHNEAGAANGQGHGSQ